MVVETMEPIPTIISQEIIKPSSPTPPHLYTYNLSELDDLSPKTYASVILFYPYNVDCNLTSQHKANVLKKSLSKCLTQYYPFAGTMTTPTTLHVDCNDHGVVFLEARINTGLDTFLNLREQDETLHQLFAFDLDSYTNPRNTSLVGVQLNHFACGGVGLAVSISHVLGDGCTLGSFLTHWASLARHDAGTAGTGTDLIPHFLNSPSRTESKAQVRVIDSTNLVSRKFVFPYSKLSELKDNVVFESNGSINNPTRVEVVTSLLFKTGVNVAAAKSGCFKPCYLFMTVNARNKFVPKLPQVTFGNIVAIMILQTGNTRSEPFLSMMVEEIKKQKLEVEGLQSVQDLAERSRSLPYKMNLMDGSYFWCSSLCGFGFNKVEFGWGKPSGTIFWLRSSYKNGFELMDSPDGGGIEAWVVLEKEDMEVFENDKELLSFCQIE